MRFKAWAGVGVASLALVSLSTINADAGTSPKAPHPRAVTNVGKVHADAAASVKLSSLPNNGAKVQGSNHQTLGRDGKPAGSQLPVAPSTGTKTTPTTSSGGPKVITSGWDGIGLANSNCGCQPPDVNAAIGPSNVVEAVNLSLAVYNKTGTLLQNTALSTFLGTSDGLSDPRVVFDPTWNRWSLVLTDTSSSSLWFAFSATSDPQSGWYVYHAFGFPGALADYPMVGMDRDAFMYTTNNYDASNNYVNSTALSIPKSLVYNGFGWGSSLPAVNYNTTPAIVGGHPPATNVYTYMLSPDDANNLMYVYQWTNTAENAKLTYKGSIAYNWAAPPRRVNQPGTSQTLDPLDGRIGWAVSQLGNKVWFAHGAAIGSFPGVNWGYVQPANMTIAVSTAFHSGTSDDFNPSIAAESYGTTTQEVLSWAYTDTPNNVATTDVYALHPGTTPSHQAGAAFGPTGGSTSDFRFGDYSSVAPEYNTVGTCAEGQVALVANQYFAADGSWKTRLARIHGNGCG